MHAALEEAARQWQAMWLPEGRSLADYNAGLDNGEVFKWQQAKAARRRR